MDTLTDNFAKDDLAKSLIVMLPGAYDSPADFVAQGFVVALRSRNIAADVMMVNAHVNYYTDTDQKIVSHLHTQIVQPARLQGYEQIWLVGISLGGYGSLLYSQKHPEMINGLFLMAPFMGPRDIPVEIQQQGGLKYWRPGNIPEDDYDRKLWLWLQGYCLPSSWTRPPIYVGFGVDDRFVASNRLLAQVLPSNQTFTVPGGHDWLPWQQLWAKFLDCAPLPRKMGLQAQICRSSDLQ